MPAQFPRNPLRGDDPFHDAAGNNPFADQAHGDAPEGNAYSAPRAAGPPQTDAGFYEPILLDRSRWIVGLGTGGIALSSVAALIALIGSLSSGSPASSFFVAFPAALAGLAVSIPGCILGGADSRAIRRGAMQANRARAVRLGYRLSIAGCILAATIMVLPVVAAVTTLL